MNLPDGMTSAHQAFLDGFHCDECEREKDSIACGDDAAHALCNWHAPTRDEVMADRMGL